MASKTYCDSCNKIITNSSAECSECDHYGTDYHQSCLKKVYDKSYCPKHVVRAENGQIIRAYINKMWADVGFEGLIDDHNGTISSQIGPLAIKIETIYDKDDENLNYVTLEVVGLANNIRKFKANLHTHENVVAQLKSAIVRSLRSKKSVLAVQQKRLMEDTARLDEIINSLLTSLNGVLVDTKELKPVKIEND